MKLVAIEANRHVFEGVVSGKPMRLRLIFEGEKVLRLQIGPNGDNMVCDEGALDDPFDMGEFGSVDTADLTSSYFSHLGVANVTDIKTLSTDHGTVGIRLELAEGEPFNFWVAGDELYWGNSTDLADFGWDCGRTPRATRSVRLY